ncbi:MAG: PEP-CTERM sorting domain-containing protein [Verrucomicrobia bacterium]|nr:MAG: PEP-CTERM sorting domain-containing protein [Verrucomicrobiota bacterium]
MKFKNFLSFLLLFTTASANAAVVNYVITGYQSGGGIQEGTNTDVPAGGSLTQTANVPSGGFVGSTVNFSIGNADAIVGDKFNSANINALPTVATLRVSVTAISAGTELMLVRTSNSQGLQDIGTMTVLLANTNSNNPNSATFKFEWFNAANTAALTGSQQMVFTSYDIDFTQRNSFAVADYSAIGFSPVTRLVSSTTSGITRVFDPAIGSPPRGSDSNFDEPRNGYAFLTVAGDFEQSISVDKAGGGASPHNNAGNQLYMISFRSPSPLIPVIPEPSAAILGGVGMLALLRRRR